MLTFTSNTIFPHTKIQDSFFTFTSFDTRDPKIFGNVWECFPDFQIIPRSDLDTRL